MSRSRRGSTTLTVAVFAGVATLTALSAQRAHREAIPERIADSTYWRIITTFSEPSGTFASENFVSNETEWQYVIPPSLDRIKKGSAYLGVGPEQNFTYIAAFKPSIAFICDIRRQNMMEHLMYKALFELSHDRADFLSKLFSRPRPDGLDSASSGAALASAYRLAQRDSLRFDINISAILNHLVRTHKFALNSEDSATIRAVYSVFYQDGPNVSYSSSSRNVRNSNAIGGLVPLVPNFGGGGNVTIRMSQNGVANTYYISDSAGKQIVTRDSAGTMVRDTTFASRATGLGFTFGGGLGAGPLFNPLSSSLYASFGSLMSLDDGDGVNRGWLGSEAAFQWMKNFEERNLLIPVVGNFAGPKALRSVSGYLKEHGTTVGTFYTSNVEQYLFQNAISSDFYENVAALPTDPSSTFIRSIPNQFNAYVLPRNPGSRLAQTTSSIDSVVSTYRRGELNSYTALQRIQDR